MSVQENIPVGSSEILRNKILRIVTTKVKSSCRGGKNCRRKFAESLSQLTELEIQNDTSNYYEETETLTGKSERQER